MYRQNSTLMGRVRRGLTLLELVVVMAILVALAAILVPTLPDMLSEANDASMVTNLTEMDKMIQSYHAFNDGAYPNGMDSLIDSSGNLYVGLPTDSDGNPVGGYLVPTELTASHVERLGRVGITEVAVMNDELGKFGATYMSSSDTTAVAEGTTLAFLNDGGDGVYDWEDLTGCKMQFEDGHEYVVMGIGGECSLTGVGNMVKDIPVCRHEEGCSSPSEGYAYICAIFDLGEAYAGGRDTGSAKFVGCVALADDYFLFSEEITNID